MNIAAIALAAQTTAQTVRLGIKDFLAFSHADPGMALVILWAAAFLGPRLWRHFRKEYKTKDGSVRKDTYRITDMWKHPGEWVPHVILLWGLYLITKGC